MTCDRPVYGLGAQLGQFCNANVNESGDRIGEQEKEWNQRMRWDDPKFAQRYVDGKLRVHIHAEATFLRGKNPINLCAIFQKSRKPNWPARLRDEMAVAGSIDSLKLRRGLHPETTASGGNQGFVFISDVQLMQLPDPGTIPSIASVKPLEQAHRFVAGSLYFSFNFGFVFLGRSERILEDRKPNGIGYDATVGINDLTGKMVEARPEIVDCIARDQAQFNRSLLHGSYAEDLISGLRIILSDDRITVVTRETLDAWLKITDVLFGPFDLGIN